MTAWAALLEFAKMKIGERVLIVGGDEIIGYSAIQLAVAHGCHIVTTCRGENIALVLAAGANQAVDCLSEDIQLAVKEKFDVVFDTIGAARTERIGLGLLKRGEIIGLSLLKRGGRYVNLKENVPLDHPDNLIYPFRDNSELIADLYKNLRIVYHTIRRPSSRPSLEVISKLVGAGWMRIPIAKTFPITQVREAFEAADNLRTLGKMVLTFD
ncbi:uncharacterized protein LOC130139680 [Syzygium oleosum]|uniref:uncharacterized protein LOC130139680 n=1 Tax=Syzygium oleosum TaxID=219896 RepID=UPI0024B9DEBC|nr:uncharacterized protein LOC130139680 [Syzygium oleosum]